MTDTGEYEYMIVEMDDRPLVKETHIAIRDKLLTVNPWRAEELKKQGWFQTSQIFKEFQDGIFRYMQVWKREDFNPVRRPGLS